MSFSLARRFGVALTLLLLPALGTPLRADNGDHPDPAQKKHLVRVVQLKGLYADHPGPVGLDPTTLLLGGGKPPKSFYKLCDGIERLAADDDIDTVLFDLSAPVGMNLAQLAEFRRHLNLLREAGKKTHAWLENCGTVQFAIASGCDTILMADFAILDMPSLGMSTMYFADAMAFLGIRASTARVGDFKGATEPFTRSRISPHLHEHYERMLTTMNDALVQDVAQGRHLSRRAVRDCQARRLFTASAAREAGLVDVLVPYGEMKPAVEKLIGEEVTWREKKKKGPQQMSFFEVWAQLMGMKPKPTLTEPTIAVLHLDGGIVDGVTEAPGNIVSGPTVKEIRKLAKNDMIKAVVVRINSPGGSATASEAVRTALAELAEAKPVAYSMGNVAASGGYWITCIGAPIFAESSTITGSIGVLAMKLDFGPLLNRVGLQICDILLDESAGMMAPNRPWRDEETALLQEYIDDVYARFLDIVAKSRGMTPESVDPIAGGRVWSGAQAAALGLVDHVGGVDHALEHLAEKAGLEPGYPVIHRPVAKSPFEMLQLMGQQEEDVDVRTLIDTEKLKLARATGFDFSPFFRLIQDSLKQNAPSVLLIDPVQIRIR